MPDTFTGGHDSTGGSSLPGFDSVASEATQDSNLLLFRRYRVLRELGRGGMGVVLLAHDTALDAPVAVKLVPETVVKDTEAVADLRKEVLRGMALMHPAIVRTHNFERDEDSAGIVMEFVEGETLSAIKQQQPENCFDPEQIFPWLEQLCAVLDYAHYDAHIVHRDLKPRNIMVDTSGRLKVADFGIAATLSDSVSRSSMEGVTSGTPSYMSPQQAQGLRPSFLDDIHALGATIYELLTSKPPFFRGNATAIYGQVMSVVPPTMAERRADLEITGKKPISPVWEDVVAACLAKDPADRPQSAGEVLARLRGGARADLGQAAAFDEGASNAGFDADEQCETLTISAQPPVPRQVVSVPAARPFNWAWGVVAAVIALVPGGGYYLTTQQGDRKISPAPADQSDSEVTTPARTTASTVTTVPQGAPKSTPPPVPVVKDPAKKADFVNSLGMEFMRVPGTKVLVCRTETRVQDFAPFAQENPAPRNGVSVMKMAPDGTTFTGWVTDGNASWRNPGFQQDGTHPVVGVSWNDAREFCAWLSKKEGRTYRLPTDEEWSRAVGTSTYPWGDVWPPQKGAGNYGDDGFVQARPAQGGAQNTGFDGYARTSPVGRLAENPYGLFDLGGNVWELCDDEYRASMNSADVLEAFANRRQERAADGTPFRILRGGSFDLFREMHLRSLHRGTVLPTARQENIGFRCVLVEDGVSVPAQNNPATPQPSAPIKTANKEAPFANSLGMEFVPVPGTNVLFCRWETRVKDYAAFITASGYDMNKGGPALIWGTAGPEQVFGDWKNPHFQQTDQHPVVCVSWEDANAFCTWLSKKEGREYRLPTDHEWSYAVGIADREDPNASPKERTNKQMPGYPWGLQWPPPSGFANLGDLAFEEIYPNLKPAISGYRDGYAGTAPVGSFNANEFGICDLSGNVWEWCETLFDGNSGSRVMRGGSWSGRTEFYLRSGFRHPSSVGYRRNDFGFRCVLVVPGS